MIESVHPRYKKKCVI